MLKQCKTKWALIQKNNHKVSQRAIDSLSMCTEKNEEYIPTGHRNTRHAQEVSSKNTPKLKLNVEFWREGMHFPLYGPTIGLGEYTRSGDSRARHGICAQGKEG